MGVSGRDVDYFQCITTDAVLQDFLAVDGAEPDDSLPADYEELLVLGVVPVVALDDAGFRDVDRYLAAFGRAQELGKGPAVIVVHLQGVAELVGGQEAQIGAVESPGQRIPQVGDRAVSSDGPEGTDALDDVSKGSCMDDGDDTIGPFPVWLPLECAQELLDNIVDVNEGQYNGGIEDCDWQVAGNVVTEGGDSAVVVGSTPFPEYIREAVDINGGASLLAISEGHILGGPFALPIRVPLQRLGRRGDDKGDRATGFEKETGQLLCQADITGCKFIGCLGAIDAGQVEDEVRRTDKGLQILGRLLHIEEQQFQVWSGCA